MSFAVQDLGLVPIVRPGMRICACPLLVIVDETDLAVIAQFLGDPTFNRSYAERIVQLLNTHGAVDNAELTSITDQGEPT